MIFLCFLPALKFLLAGTVCFFIAGDGETDRTLVVLLVVQALFLVVFGRHWLNNARLQLLTRQARSPGVSFDRLFELRLLGWIAGGLTVVAYLLHGVPLLSGDPNAAKVLLSDSWLLMRGLRFIVPVVVFVRLYLYFVEKAKLQFGDWTLALFFVLIAAASGYKGYVLSYIMLPAIFAFSLFSNSRWSPIKSALLAVLGTLFVVANIAFNEGLSLSDGFQFFFFRISFAQAEGALHIMMHPHEYIDVSPMALNVNALLGRVFGGEGSMNFNAVVFDMIHGENPLKMQISVPLFMEFYLEAGIVGALSVLFGELIFFRFMLVRFFAETGLFPLGLTFGTFLLFIDVVMNGGVILRFLDWLISAGLLFSLVLLIRFVIFACSPAEQESQLAVA
jgi:hypothetical protein